jgi:hypothetical protein
MNEVQNNTHSPPAAPLLVSERVAASMLSVCPKTVYNMRMSGQLPCVKLGQAVRYSVDSLHQFIKAKETFSTAA